MKQNLVLLALLVSVLLCGCTSPIQQKPVQTNAPETQNPEETAMQNLTEPETTEAVAMLDPIGELMMGMTLEEKVGQLFLGRCPEENAEQDVSSYHLGGYILFGRDFDGRAPESVIETISRYQQKTKIPMLIAVDEEGGTVCRVSSNRSFRQEQFPSPRVLYSQGGMDYVLSMEAEKAILLNSLGINVNMAPVCDVTDQQSAFMYKRSISGDPRIVGAFACGAVSRMEAFHVGAVLKHFPGYGNNADTHTGIAVDARTLAELENSDLKPFAQAIQAGKPAILMSHTIVQAFDQELPASLSPAVHDYLRRHMEFDGVIITDDLAMDAIEKQYGTADAAVQAVLAGNDLLCSTDYQVQYSAVLEAVQSGRIPETLLDEAVERVLRWKQYLQLIV